MKHFQSFFTDLPWKPTLLFNLFSIVLLFLYQLIIRWFYGHTNEYILSFAIKTPYTVLILYLTRAFSFSILLTIPILCYLNYHNLRIRQLIKVVSSWKEGDFSLRAQENIGNNLGALPRHLDEMAQELQKLMEWQKEVVSLNERNLLARELHDTVKQQVFALAFQINLARKLHTSKSDQLAMHLLEAKKILSDVQVELTNLIVPMRKSALENHDLTDALASLLSRWSQQYGILVKYTTEIQGQEKNYFFPSNVKNTFFRVAQEALSNVGRHSNASRVDVTLTIGWQFIIFRIADNGQGINSAQLRNGSVGISSMHERMKEIDGEFSIESKLHFGTEIIATYHPKDTGPNVAIFNTAKETDLEKINEMLNMNFSRGTAK